MNHIRFLAAAALLLIVGPTGCATKTLPVSEEPLVAEINPSLSRADNGSITLKVQTNLPDGTQLRAFLDELPEMRGCSVARNICDFAAWDQVPEEPTSFLVSIQADFGHEDQPEPVLRVVGVLGVNLRGPLAIPGSGPMDPVNLRYKERVPVAGS